MSNSKSKSCNVNYSSNILAYIHIYVMVINEIYGLKEIENPEKYLNV